MGVASSLTAVEGLRHHAGLMERVLQSDACGVPAHLEKDVGAIEATWSFAQKLRKANALWAEEKQQWPSICAPSGGPSRPQERFGDVRRLLSQAADVESQVCRFAHRLEAFERK